MATSKKKGKKKKERVEVETWGLSPEDLSFDKQLNTINKLLIPLHLQLPLQLPLQKIDKYEHILINHIKRKIHSYRHQDIIKKKYNESEFIDFDML